MEYLRIIMWHRHTHTRIDIFSSSSRGSSTFPNVFDLPTRHRYFHLQFLKGGGVVVLLFQSEKSAQKHLLPPDT